MGTNCFGHLAHRMEHRWEGRAISLQDRVVWIVRVKGHGAGVGVDDDLDRVACVVEAGRKSSLIHVEVRGVLAVGVLIGRGVTACKSATCWSSWAPARAAKPWPRSSPAAGWT